MIGRAKALLKVADLDASEIVEGEMERRRLLASGRNIKDVRGPSLAGSGESGIILDQANVESPFNILIREARAELGGELMNAFQ